MTSPTVQRRSSGKSWWLDLALLAALSAIFYLPGLDRHGVTNWQEAKRLVVARDMQRRLHTADTRTERLSAWLVPTANGKPYLAKPPLVYWAQLALAEPVGQRVELWHLRLAVALGGIAGVLAAYALGRVLFATAPGGRSIALWSALLLATGILSTRSARIGELDVFLMPLCTAAIACAAVAWRSYRERARTRWPAVLGATLFTALAVLTKDTAVMIVGFGGFAAVLLYHANEPRPRANRWRTAASVLAGAGAALAALLNAGGVVDVLGAGLVGLGCFLLVEAFAPVLAWARLRQVLRAMARVHPLLVLGVPLLVRIGWAIWVDRLAGAGTAESLGRAEVEDNVRLFVAEAPINNLQAAAYGVGLGSVAAIGVAVWAVRRRGLRWTPEWAHLVAWIGLGLLAFSVLGKGVPRYLTPLWPAVALVGGWGVHHGLRWARLRERQSAAPWLGAALAGGLIAFGLAQTAWYGYGREIVASERSPRALAEAVRREMDVRERTRVFSFEFATPALDYAFGYRVRALGDPRVNSTMAGGVPWTLGRLHRFLAANTRPRRSAILLVRDHAVPGIDPTPAPERLRAAGFTLEEIDVPESARFEIDRGRTHIRVYRATVPIGADGAATPDDDADDPSD